MPDGSRAARLKPLPICVQTCDDGCTNAAVRTGNHDNAAIGVKLAGIDKGHDRDPPLHARRPVWLP